MTDNNVEKWSTLKEVQEHLGVGRETILHWILNTETATKFCDNWNSEIEINPNFKLLKQEIDFEDFSPSRKYDLIYFDAFSPDTQPEMWTLENLRKIINNLTDGGIFVTYCSKGILKQNLRNLNMIVKRIQGPKGKRHVIRATKDINFYT